MNSRFSYEYSTLRYVHDIGTGEFINVGVAVFSADSSFLDFKYRKVLGRIHDIFPDINVKNFKALLRGVEKRFREVALVQATPMPFSDKPTNLAAILLSILPKDDSALRWSDVAMGLSNDLAKTISDLFDRYTKRYDKSRNVAFRTEEDMWKGFKRKLEDRSITQHFVPVTIAGKNDDLDFEVAYKNGIWHCIETISFDLTGEAAIREKAHKRAGELVGIADAATAFKVYFVLGKPSNPELQEAFEKAKGILNNLVVSKEIFDEAQEDVLVSKLNEQISAGHADA